MNTIDLDEGFRLGFLVDVTVGIVDRYDNRYSVLRAAFASQPSYSDTLLSQAEVKGTSHLDICYCHRKSSERNSCRRRLR